MTACKITPRCMYCTCKERHPGIEHYRRPTRVRAWAHSGCTGVRCTLPDSWTYERDVELVIADHARHVMVERQDRLVHAVDLTERMRDG